MAVAAVMLVYMVTLAMMPRDGFWINDNGVKFLQMKGISLNRFEEAIIPWPGESIDPDFRFNPLTPPFGLFHEGRLYGFYSLPFAALSAIPYQVFGINGLYLLPLLGALLMMVSVGRIARLLPGRPVVPAICLTALGTPIWFYSVTFWEHLPATGLTTLSVFYGIRYTLEGNRRHIAASAASLAAAVYFRDELYLFVLPLLTVIIRGRPIDRRGFLLFGTTAAAVLAPLWIFNGMTFGNPLGLRLATVTPAGLRLAAFLADRPEVMRLLFLNGHGNWWMSAIACAPFVVLLLWYPRIPSRRLNAVMVCLGGIGLISGWIVWQGFWDSERPLWWLLRSNGLFAAAPLLIWAFVRPLKNESTGPDKKRTDIHFLVWRTVLIYAVLYALLSPLKNIAGIHWGCRFLLPLYPLMGLLAASNLGQTFGHRRRSKPVIALAAAVILISISLQIYGLDLLYRRKDFNARLNRWVAAQPVQTVAAIGWFVPQELSTVFYDKEIFLASTPPQFNDLITHLRERNISRVMIVSSRHLNHPDIEVVKKFSDGLGFIDLEIGMIDL